MTKDLAPMDITIRPSRPENADTLAFAIARDALAALPLAASRTLVEGARAARFSGEAGSSFESFVEEEGRIVRVVLLGTGSGSDADMEKAGGALTARLATSGAAHVAIVFPHGASGSAAAHLALGVDRKSVV